MKNNFVEFLVNLGFYLGFSICTIIRFQFILFYKTNQKFHLVKN